ncbi:hypothetical protein Sar04_36620 [Salinispora arenicola]|uniref:Uncharacterized protein n=1 Tax=Salinispora arenicola TaxID=168697 RepID=A0ABQ4JY69_SALAC|nr:hypothetical protein Sar04_36620 [Salinispora arenicola]
MATFQSSPQAQKMTPKATAMTAATITSMVRQRSVVGVVIGPPCPVSGNQARTHVRARRGRVTARLEADRTPCAGITQIRFKGL